MSSVASIQPATPFTLAVHITVHPGWHTYWINGGDAGDELLVEWSLPEGFTAGPFQWPVPKLLPAPPLMSYGYEGQVFVLRRDHSARRCGAGRRGRDQGRSRLPGLRGYLSHRAG